GRQRRLRPSNRALPRDDVVTLPEMLERLSLLRAAEDVQAPTSGAARTARHADLKRDREHAAPLAVAGAHGEQAGGDLSAQLVPRRLMECREENRVQLAPRLDDRDERRGLGVQTVDVGMSPVETELAEFFPARNAVRRVADEDVPVRRGLRMLARRDA